MKKFIYMCLSLSLLQALLVAGDVEKAKPKKLSKEERMMRAYDADKDGMVSLEEFLEKPKNLFALKDSDGDGQLTAEELVAKPRKPERPKKPKKPKKTKVKKGKQEEANEE